MKYLILLALLIPLVLAHGSDGGGEDVRVGDYFIDFGYEPKELRAGESSRLNFFLIDPKTNGPVDPDNVWIRISSSSEILYSGNQAPQQAGILFSFSFPYPDQYEVTTRFYKNNEELAEYDFNVEVAAGETTISRFEGLGGVIIIVEAVIIVILLIGLIIVERKLKK